MALVKVVGLSGNVQTVPRSMYESYLKNKGYVLFNDVVKGSQKVQSEPAAFGDVEVEVNVVGDQDPFEEGNDEYDIESIPIGEMNGKQVRQYAELKGIDVSGAKSTREAKDIIRKWMQENGE